MFHRSLTNYTEFHTKSTRWENEAVECCYVKVQNAHLIPSKPRLYSHSEVATDCGCEYHRQYGQANHYHYLLLLALTTNKKEKQKTALVRWWKWYLPQVMEMFLIEVTGNVCSHYDAQHRQTD